jgi:predicted DNA binding protein
MVDTQGFIITEFRLDHPILRDALAQVPEMHVTWERSDPSGDDRIRVLLWAEGGDFAAFEAALDDDPTTTSPRRTVEFDDRRLYQLELVDEGRETSIYPILVEQGGIIQELTATHKGWEFRVSFPAIEDFRVLREFCEDRDIEFTFDSVYVQDATPDSTANNLTRRQRDILQTALETGYFEIPREASLDDVADAVGISSNAASERLRRGMRRLVESAVTQ